jgi:hypothetical protein
MLPDGRRVIGTLEAFPVTEPVPPSETIEAFNPGVDLATAPQVAGWYRLDGDYHDARGQLGDLVPAGDAGLDPQSFSWSNRPGGAALRVYDLGDQAVATVPLSALTGASPSAISVEAMLYVNRFRAYGRSNANILQLSANWEYALSFWEGAWDGLHATGGQTNQTLAYQGDLSTLLSPGTWHHLKLQLTSSGYALEIDGVMVTSAPSPDLSGWPTSGDATLTIGNFDGWIDEVVVQKGG